MALHEPIEGSARRDPKHIRSVVGGGQPTPFYDTLKAFKEDFPPGTQIYRTTSSSPEKVIALGSAKKTLLVNKTDSARHIRLNGASFILFPYEVRVVDTPLLTAPND